MHTPRRPKIIFTVTNDLVYDRRMLRIADSLSRAGFETQLVGRVLPQSPTFVHPRIGHKRFKLWFNKGKLFYIEYQIRLFFWLLFQRFDVVCGIDLDTLLPCFFVAKIRQKPCVYDAHEYFTEVPEVVRRPLVQKVWQAVEKWVVPRLKYAYTVSQSIAEAFETAYGTPFALVRNMPERQENTQVRHIPDVPILFYQGNLNEGRGLETVIDALPQLPNVVFWIVGEGDLSAALRAQVQALSLTDRVVFWGYIAPDRLFEMTVQATIGVHITEDKGLSYRYSLGNKFLDYIQAGVPQVSTAFIEHQRLNDQYDVGLLIAKTDVDLFVAAVKTLLEQPELYAHKSRQCLKAAALLNWQAEEQILLDFYRRFL